MWPAMQPVSASALFIIKTTAKGNSVIQLPSAPIEASRIINISYSIYSGTDRVRLNFFSQNRINRVLELELEHTDNDCRMF